MELIRDEWTSKDLLELNKYLESIKVPEKIEFTKRVVNTNMPLLGINIPTLESIAKEIAKGNYLSFLDNCQYEYYDLTIIGAKLINRISDYDVLEKTLSRYLKYCDNWSSIDTLKLKIKGNEDKIFKLAKKYTLSKKTFTRRCGFIIFFKFIKEDNYIAEIFNTIDTMYDEEEYYVNMGIAWLLCELMIKRRKETLTYLKHHHLNTFVLNKFISKCHDSFRISAEDKELLKTYR